MSELLEEDQLRKLIELGPALVSELDVETLLGRVVDTARAVTGAQYAALGILDAERRELERFITRGLSAQEELAIGDRPRGRGVLGLLIDDPIPVRVTDIHAHPRSFGFPAGHPPMRSFLGAPILIRGRAWGNLYLTDKPTGEFTDADERAVVTLAAWASIAIEHARLLAASAQRRAELEAAVRRLEATQSVAVAVGAETDLTRVLELIAKRGRAIVEARSVLILLREGDELVVASVAGHGEAQTGARLPIAASTSGQAMLAKRPTRIGDPASQLLVSPERLGVPDARSGLFVPLVYRGDALGVMAAFDRGAEALEFDENDEQVLVAFAASAATAVATAQTVQAERLRSSLSAAEAERKHWARELHDETLQALGGMKVLASAARRAPDAEQMRTALEQIVEGLEEQIESVHTIISELRPAALDELGLGPALETLAERHLAAYGCEVILELELPDPLKSAQRLSPELDTAIYRMIQEALTNTAKHARASRVSVSVATVDGAVNIEVADNGEGFDVAAPSSGFGLTGMRERATLANGSFEIASGDHGTRVRACLPTRA